MLLAMTYNVARHRYSDFVHVLATTAVVVNLAEIEDLHIVLEIKYTKCSSRLALQCTVFRDVSCKLTRSHIAAQF